MTKMTVLYHSVNGNTKRMADVIAEGMAMAEGAKPKVFPIEEIDETWVKESKCVIVGTPIYFASVSAAVKGFLERQCFKYDLAGKIGGAFATANYVHGGVAYGNPVIHLGPVALTGRLDESIDTFKLYGQRMAIKTIEIFK